jgi:hypothetical protein
MPSMTALHQNPAQILLTPLALEPQSPLQLLLPKRHLVLVVARVPS